MQMNIRSSYDSFRDLRENESYYVDKTAVIEEYLVKYFEKAVLFTRPRRFGKTLTMSCQSWKQDMVEATLLF